jgi:hypothetical protein
MPNLEESLPSATGQSNLGARKDWTCGGRCWRAEQAANTIDAAITSAIQLSHCDFLLPRRNTATCRSPGHEPNPGARHLRAARGAIAPPSG